MPSSPSLARWLKRIAPARARGTLSVAVVSDARVRTLNRRYRGVDRATDVLSFPVPAANHRSPITDHRSLATDRCLGDIVIARGVARRQAREAGHSELTEWRVLALHGLLHLLGYDHERDAGRMRRVEARLRRRGGLPGGLIERAGRR
jgi:probable rRNA maturation factor